MDRLRDKVAIVSGGSKGIGEGISRRFAEEGATVIIASRNVEECKALAADLISRGYHADARRLDIASFDEWSTIVDYAMDTYGRIDILANNAGRANTGAPMDQMDLEADWHALINCNLTGTFYGMYTVIPRMMEQKSGVIINTSSYGGTCAVTGVSGYSAAKGAINSLTRDVAAAYGQYGIRCNSVAPGATLTPAVEQVMEAMPDVLDGLIASCCLPRLGTPKDIADAYVYLASDEASYVTGQILLVDGGYTIK